MSTFLTRLRSLRRSRPNSSSNPPIKSIATDLARNERRDAHTAVEDDASPESPSRNIELDSKIYPDLSALFASVEEALKSHERVAEAQKEVHLYDDSDSENDYGNEQSRDAQRLAHSTNDSALYASFGSGLGTGRSTFGQDDSPCPRVPERTHIVSSRDNNSRNNNGRAIAANFHPSSTTDAGLSWSPKPVESLESLRPTNFSYSSPALYPSPEIQQQNTQTSVYYSPSPGTFGYPTPPHIDPVDFPSFPAPAFHSTPKTSASSRTRSLPKRSPRTSGRSRIPRLTPNNSRMKRTKFDLPRISRRRTTTTAIGALEQKLTSIRSSTSVSKIPVRRKSAEWNSRAATAGVVADPKQTTEFSWPAEVSREILRLSLGEDLMLHSHSHGQDAPSTPTTTTPGLQPVGMRDTQNRDGPPANLKRGAPRVSHGHKLNERLIIRPSISEHRLSSAHLYSSTVPPSSSTSSAPGRSDRPQTTATQVSSTRSAPSVAAQKNSRSQSSGDNALDTSKSDSEMGATGVTAHHKRSESENKVNWESAELQEFISREESGGDLSGDALRRPSTPMKKSESESTYQTAGSSSYLHAPSLSVIAPTPRSSPGGSRHSSGGLPEATYGLQVPTPPPQTAKSKGKRKAEESEDGSPSPPDVRALQNKKVEDLAADAEPRRDSNVSRAPSSFQSFQSQKSRKRVRLSSPMATPDHSRPGSTVPHHLGSVSSRGSSRSAVPHSDSKVVPPRSVSRASRTSRAMSAAPSGSSSIAFPGRRSLSQTSIPISAIVTPRAPSVDRLSSFHMRDPRRPSPQREIGWTLRFPSFDDRGSPFAAWAFWFGFPFPLLWWLASFWRIPQTRMVGTDTEKAVVVDDPFYEREARAWRLRCRVASALFFVTYVPVIVLLAVFV